MARQQRSTVYPFLQFAANVDWHHVDPALLQKLNQMAARKGVTVDVFSGYRSDAYSAKVGGFAGDPHTRGIAVDANVGGKPIGSVFTVKDFKAAGLITGNQPNFYNGKPDPSHVQIGTGNYNAGDGGGAAQTASPTQVPAAASPAPAAGATAPLSLPDPTFTAPPPTAGAMPGPDVQMPGSVNYTTNNLKDLWDQVASQSFVSPDTRMFAQNASILGG